MAMDRSRPRAARRWYVYVLLSPAGRTYVGVSNDVVRRLSQHNGAARGGAKATRAGRPWRIGSLYGAFASCGDAQRIEYAVKRLRGADRLRYPGKRAVPPQNLIRAAQSCRSS